jgi:5-methylthioadenosine/S-adenosylhomocysteine deaminase
MAHCIWLDDDELDVLSETGTHVMHCPCCNLKLGSGIARIPEMLARGISVSLGSDGAPSNNNLDMFIEMRVASLIHKYRLGAEALPAREVLGMATKGGAAALGLSDQIGSLEPEKKADLIILDDGGVHAAPIMDFELDDPVERIVSAFQSASVRTSIINGQIVMDNRKLVSMDEEDVIEKARVALRTLHEAAS